MFEQKKEPVPSVTENKSDENEQTNHQSEEVSSTESSVDSPSVSQQSKEPEDIFAETEPLVATADQSINDNLTKQSANKTIRQKSAFSVKKIIVWLIILAVLAGIFWGGWQIYRLISIKQIIQSEDAKTTEPTQPAVNPLVEEKTEPVVLDSDRDGLTDEEEAVLGTDPRTIDTDQDGLTDREEVEIYKTNPLNIDSDGDGYPDGMEVNAGYNPNNSSPGAKLLDLQSEIEKLK